MSESPMPWESASAFLADVVARGGSQGKTLDVRERADGCWDVVLVLDGGYSERTDAEGSLVVEVENLARAYVAEVEAGRVEPASEAALSRIGLRAGARDATPT